MEALPDRITPMTQTEYEQTFGGALICTMIMLFLYGISSLQTYIYFNNYPKDKMYMKCLVLGLWTSGTAHSFFLCHTMYHYLVSSYTNPMSLASGVWSVYTATCVGVVVAFVVQVFFARMIYYLTVGWRRVILTAVLAFFILAQIAFGIFLCYDLFHVWELGKLGEVVYPAMIPLFFTRVASDTITSITLCAILYDSRTKFKRSIRLVKTLTIYAMNRFVLTSVVVIVQTVILIVRPQTIWAMVIEFISVQLYTNSFLATLNSRNHVRGIGDNTSDYITTGRSVQFNRGAMATELTAIDTTNNKIPVDWTNPPSGGIRINKESVVVSDYAEPNAV